MKGNKVLKLVVMVGALCLVFGAGQAMAQTLTVSATVGRHCVITSGSVAFGDYDPTAAAPDTASGTFTVRCSRSATPAQIGLDNGQNFGNGSRRMISGAEFLEYGLYKDNAHANPWTQASPVVVNGSTVGEQTLTVYGVIPAAQDKAADLVFGDSVNITLVF